MFTPGDKVVCIHNAGTGLVHGQTYTIRTIWIGILPDSSLCSLKEVDSESTYYLSRFIPLASFNKDEIGAGDKVICIVAPRSLRVGHIYTIRLVERHSYGTLYSLVGMPAYHRFDSIRFVHARHFDLNNPKHICGALQGL